MARGTLSLSDLLATTDQSIVDSGPGYEDMIWGVFDNALTAHNRILDELMATYVERTTDRLIGTGGIADMTMDDIDEYGSPHVQKVTAGENLGFPLRLTGIAIQWTRTYFEEANPRDIAVQFVAAMDADRKRLTRDLKRAIYGPTNVSFVDRRVKDLATIPVKALANADGMAIPVGPNGEQFVAATHQHYIGSATLTAASLDSLILLVAEHYSANDVVLTINQAQEATIRALTGFTAYLDTRVVQSQTATYAVGELDLFQYNNREIGLFNGAVVAVRPWAVPSYVVATNRSAPKILAMREKRPGSGDFRMSYEDENHPLRARGFHREFGFGVRNRVGAAVLYIGGGTYVAPTITS